ncbi:hypothetical protein ACIBF5_08230 [Micromonospora sp. NPDC050417]|uniref:hypothetical protein n=1 Tax=Micromonospora sp. NPDC050417 TaxID=3364280 RepID=UPI00378A965F
MSLDMIIGREAAADFLTEWPTKPFTLTLPPDSPIGRVINAKTIRGFLDAGCAPSNYVNMFHRGEALHPGRFTSDDRVAPASVQLLIDQGVTIQLRELNRWHPYAAPPSRRPATPRCEAQRSERA